MRTAPKSIAANSVNLTVTSPPFLDVIQYARDNWLRCWFNGYDADEIGASITMSKTIEDWGGEMANVLRGAIPRHLPGRLARLRSRRSA